jgi:hypothetical protein
MELPSKLQRTLVTLLSELVDGASAQQNYMLNPGDRGLLAALDDLSPAEASAIGPSGSSIAAHADHLRYGLSLMNRWSVGENPFADAAWGDSWRRTTVTDQEWAERRRQLRDEVSQWSAALSQPRSVNSMELAAMIGSIVHLAYHLGAIRQIQPALRGPRETG